MKSNLINKLLFGTILTISANAYSEIVLPKASPLAKITQRVGITDITLEYSSPAVKGRKIFGELVKFDEVWRTGANSCTNFITSTPIIFGGKELAAGKYCLFTIPSKTSWTLVLNGIGDQPGAFAYDKNKDVLRVDVKPIKAPLTERMTFTFADFTESKTKLNLNWDTVQISIPIEIKTIDFINKNISEISEKNALVDYADAAKFFFQDMGDIDRAHELVNKSLAEGDSWQNKWIKAQIYAKKGLLADAVKFCNESLALGDNSMYFKFMKPQIEKAIVDWK